MGFDPMGQMLHVDIAEALEEGVDLLVPGIPAAEPAAHFRAGRGVGFHVPHPAVVGEKRIDRPSVSDAGFQCGAGQGEAAALAGAEGAESPAVDLGHVRGDAHQGDGVQEYLTVEEIVGLPFDSPDKVALKGIARRAAGIGGFASLSPHIHGENCCSGGGVGQQVPPAAGVHGISVKTEDGGNRFIRLSGMNREDAAGMNSGPPDSGEVEAAAFGEGHLEFGPVPFGLESPAFLLIQIFQGTVPVVIEIRGLRAGTPIGFELFFREIETEHGSWYALMSEPARGGTLSISALKALHRHALRGHRITRRVHGRSPRLRPRRPAGIGSFEFVSGTKDSDIVFERFR